MATFNVSPKRRSKDGPEPVHVEAPFIRIGRNMNLDVVLEDMLVSFEHARIEFDGREFTIQDAGSHSGTYLGGQTLTRPTALHAGQKIVIGTTQLEVTECDVTNATLSLTREEVSAGKKNKEEAGEGATLTQRRGIERIFSLPRLFVYGGVLGTVAALALPFVFGEDAFSNGDISAPHALASIEDEDGNIQDGLACGSCHVGIGAGVASDTCFDCHVAAVGAAPDASLTAEQNARRELLRPHAYPYPDDKESLVTDGQCNRCHDEHLGRDGKLTPDHLPARECEGCHPTYHEKYSREGANVRIKYDVFPHDLHLTKGKEEDRRCERCHLMPDADAPVDPTDTQRDDFPEVSYERCVDCHYHREQVVEDHGSLAICSRCHVRETGGPLRTAKETRVRLASVSYAGPQQHSMFMTPGHEKFMGQNCEDCHVDPAALDNISKIKKQPFVHTPHITATKPDVDADIDARTSALKIERDECLECHPDIPTASTPQASVAPRDASAFGACDRTCHSTPPEVELKAPVEVTVAFFGHDDHMGSPRDPAYRRKMEESGEAGRRLLQERCFACHEVKPTKTERGDVSDRMSSKDSLEDCVECHTKKHEVGVTSVCAECHIAETDTLFREDAEPPTRVKTPSFFSHKTPGHRPGYQDRNSGHRIKDCESCHDDVRGTKLISQIDSPRDTTDESCVPCHSGGQIAWDCSNCHKFHQDPMLERIAKLELEKKGLIAPPGEEGSGGGSGGSSGEKAAGEGGSGEKGAGGSGSDGG